MQRRGDSNRMLEGVASRMQTCAAKVEKTAWSEGSDEGAAADVHANSRAAAMQAREICCSSRLDASGMHM